MPRGRRGEHQFQGCCSGPLTLPPQAARADTPPLIKPFRFGQQETSIEDVTLTQETVPQTPEDQCLDLGVRLHKAHMSPQRLRTAQCCESCAPARSHPSTRGQDVLSSSLPTPRCRRPKPRHHLRSKSRSGPQQSRGNRPPKAGAPTCGPFLLLPPGKRLVASPKLGPWGRDLGRPRQARSPLPGSRGSAFTRHWPVPRRLPALLRCLRAPCSSSACCRPKTKQGA